jgi:hypothetical protein
MKIINDGDQNVATFLYDAGGRIHTMAEPIAAKS